jgi:type II secretory pathway pseudopilin PulG
MKRPAFTLVELIVAIALCVIIMYGVVRVFATTQSVIGANQAISNATRDARAAQSVMASDFGHLASDSPFIYIHNGTIPAFRNRPDMDGDRDGNPLTQDFQGTQNIETDVTRPAQVNGRNHRLDQLTFFARGLFKRQTGGRAPSGDSPFIANMSSAEALIHYGHMRIADNAGSATIGQDPGAGTLGTNPNNFFATQWVIGREAILLREKSGTGGLTDNSGTAQVFLDGAGALAPLTAGTGTNPNSAYRIVDSRYDLAATSIGGYRGKLQGFISGNPNIAWWDQLAGSSGARFRANPIITKPITPETISQQAPIFLRGATQFIVEYAGDFVRQSLDTTAANYGQVTGVYKPTSATTQPATDGQIDFIAIPAPLGSPAGTPPSRRIRWYGQPRWANGSLLNGSPTIPGYTAGMTNANQLTEVVPLRDVWMTLAAEAAANAGKGAPFERDLLASLPAQSDYMATMTSAQHYDCAWSPTDVNRPKMIRLIFTLDDPLGRTPEGQTFELVFEVP